MGLARPRVVGRASGSWRCVMWLRRRVNFLSLHACALHSLRSRLAGAQVPPRCLRADAPQSMIVYDRAAATYWTLSPEALPVV